MVNYSEMITALAADYLNVYIVEPELDRGSVLKLDGYVIEGLEGKPKSFAYAEKLKVYASARVYSEDQDAFLSSLSVSSLLKVLKEESKDKIEFSYRTISKGEIRHYTALYIKVSKPGKPLRVVAGFRNIDDIIYAEKEIESEGALKAYSAISDVYLSMHRVDLKNDTYSTIKTIPEIASATPSKHFSGNVVSIIERFASPESKLPLASFLNTKTLEERMEGKKHISVLFESKLGSNARLHFIKEDEDEDGRLHHVLFAVEMLDENKYQSVFDVLSQDYMDVFYFSLDSGKGRIMKAEGKEGEGLKSKVFAYEELVKPFIDGFVHPDERKSLSKALSLEHLKEVFARQDSYSGNFRAIENGKYHHYSYDFYKMKEFRFLVCGFRNIDALIASHEKEERKQKEKEASYQRKLQESYNNLQEMKDILEASEMGTWKIFLLDGKDPQMEADELMKDLLGIKGKTLSKEETYKAWFDNILPDAVPSVLSSVAKMEEEGFDENTYLWKHPTLGERYVRCGGTAIKAEGGYILRGYHYDVDELVRSEKEKERKLAEATLLEKEHSKVISSIAKIFSTIFSINVKTYSYEIINEPQRFVGLAKKKGDFRDIIDFACTKMVAEDCSEAKRAFLDFATLDERLKDSGTIAVDFRERSGRWFQGRFIEKSRNAQGELEEVLYVAREITKEKEQETAQENALRDALLVAKHASRAKTTFLNNMSHDIRTPMNAIIGFTALAETHINNKEQVQDYLAKIHTSSTHLLSLINEILDMSRIESGTVKLEENPVHMPDVLHDLRTMIQGQVSAKQQNLYIDTLDVTHEDVITDKLRLNQVLLNIVGNAIKYTGIGGNIFIRVSELPCKKEGYTTYQFDVKDNGIGMSEEFKSTVFDAFSRERSTTVSGIQGTGLGMSITKNIVELMGGVIEVESEKGKGSDFRVTVDFRLADKAIAFSPIPNLKGARALVVDDDIYTCQSVSKMLRDICMRPDWSTSGKEAIVRAKEAFEIKDEYKVFIIDYLMPDMNGIETVRRIRKTIGEEVPIIVLTAYDWSDIEEEARAAGVTAFVAKPIFMSELREVLSSPEEKKEAKPSEEPDEYDFSGKRVLLVEDNDLNREIATALLGEIHVEVETASDGTDAISIISRSPDNHFDAVFMDIQMPKMDGYTATREIRTLPSNSKANLPIIAMTANAFEEDRQKAFEAGMNGHIAKPISIKSVGEALKRVFTK